MLKFLKVYNAILDLQPRDKMCYAINGRHVGGKLCSNMAAACSDDIQFSQYFASLTGAAKNRYLEKVKLCTFDPYCLKNSEFSVETSLLPAIQYPDIVNYLVLQTSWATKDMMKAYKSLEAYNFFISGWVNTLHAKKVDDNKTVIFARVSTKMFLRLKIVVS